VNLSPDDAMELGQLPQFLDDWLATDHGPVNESLTRSVGCDAYGVHLCAKTSTTSRSCSAKTMARASSRRASSTKRTRLGCVLSIL
jgi:hypothetical protein